MQTAKSERLRNGWTIIALWIPVWLGVRYLPPKLQIVLYASTAAMLFSFFFSTWNETRVWSEWTVVFAILAGY